LGHTIHLIATVRNRPGPDELRVVQERVARLDLVERRSNLAGLLSSLPLQVSTRRGLRSVPLWPHYDLTLLEQEFTSSILENPQLHTSRVILRVHNDEPEFLTDLRMASPSAWKQAYYALEARRFQTWSPYVFSKVDGLWFISSDHCRKWIEAHPGEAGHATWLPPPITRTMLPPRPAPGANVLFVGNLVAPTNIQGLEWYLNEVQPALRRIPGYRFTIAGSLLGNSLPPALRRARERGDCSLLLNARDLTAVYRESAIFVNPMQRGASLKLKTINAAEQGLPIVTTSVGNEGTGFQHDVHLLVADQPAGFASSVHRLLTVPQDRMSLTISSQNFLRARYDQGQQLCRLLAPAVLGAS
jgi:glycosyltransferase involved in cell wall biosynthesis